MDFLKQIAMFERKLNCRLCFHDFSGELTALAGREALPLHHTNPYCEAVRSFSPERYAECLKCDTGRVVELLRNGFPFCKKCHAGFLEYVFPLFKFRRLAGAMFLGVFRSGEKTEWVPPLRPPPGTPEEEELLFFGKLFADSIGKELERLPENCPRGKRREQIHLWFVHNFRKPDVSLGDLAANLGLSESRTGQLLREDGGAAFPERLRGYRLQCAKEILLNSALPVNRIAELCGFRSANYLHRSFRRAEGSTPEAWRTEMKKKAAEL